MNLLSIVDHLVHELDAHTFSAPVAYVYNPLVYARPPFEAYIRRFGRGKREILLVGMNPGPFGMAQTGVPFGDVKMVREWMGIEGPVGKPRAEHPKRPVEGFACPRSEVSGTRLWGWARERFGPPEAFFQRFFVYNFCPLVFMEESGRNRTPDKLPAAEKKPLLDACNHALAEIAASLQPDYVLGVGGFAEKQILAALDGKDDVIIGRIPHPSPANPAANRGWAAAAEKALAGYGIGV